MTGEPRAERRAGLSTDQLWGLIIWRVPPAGVLLARMDTNDLAYQVRSGALVLAHWHILRTDPFTFTVGGKA